MLTSLHTFVIHYDGKMSTELTTSEQRQLVNSEQKEHTEQLVTCENCHAQVDGRFCSQCGQSVESTLQYFWTVILHLLDDFFSFDSRANRTLVPLLFRPGFLTSEYIAGKRVHYVPPLRLYLFISIVFFISLKFFINSDDIYSFQPKENKSEVVKQIENKLTDINESLKTTSEQSKSTLKEQQQQLETFKADIQQQANEELSSVATQLAQAALDENAQSSPLTQEKYTKLKKHLAQAKEQEKKTPQTLSIGNNKDGSFSLPFLSEQENKHLDTILDDLETKTNKAFWEDPKKLLEAMISKMPQIMFVLLPLFAMLLKIMYVFSKRLYLEHLTVALHSHSFIFFSILLIEITGFLSDVSASNNVPWLSDLLSTIQVCLLLWIPIYLYIMQKRIYQQGYFFTTVKYVVVGFIYTMMISTAGIVAIVWGAVSS